MIDQLRFIVNRIRERLWVRPLFMCLVSLVLVSSAEFLGRLVPAEGLPDISIESLNKLLTISSSSMLVIATLAVTTMISAYASASGAATPRAFRLVVRDDVTQNALSVFLGAFIYSIVALIALLNHTYEASGRFVLFLVTVTLLAAVVLTFVWWVDRIARLGRVGETVSQVEAGTAAALRIRRSAPTLRARPLPADWSPEGHPVYGASVGYVQHIEVGKLQELACDWKVRISVVALPGTFAAPGRALAWVQPDDGEGAWEEEDIRQAFLIGKDRIFDEDPRFGLVVLSEIASRALSPAVNDPGTAISIIGVFVRLLSDWGAPLERDEEPEIAFDRIFVPQLNNDDLFDDAFSAIARDGAGMVEVMARLLKALEALSIVNEGTFHQQASTKARQALARATDSQSLAEDKERLKRLTDFARPREG